MDLERLLLQVGTGKGLSERDRDKIRLLFSQMVVQAAEDPTKFDDLYSVLVLVRRSQAKELISEIERCLDLKDAMLVGLSLEVLCLDWQRTEDYLERVLSFAVGVAWDCDEDVRHVAIGILGEFLRTRVSADGSKSRLSDRERHVLSYLFFALREKAAEVWTRRAAYRSLCRVAGLEWTEIPHEYEQFSVESTSTEINWEMLRSLEGLIT